jgi:hypothetical protein
MQLEDATFEAFGYYASEFKPHSSKPILASCEFCGKFGITTKRGYHTFYHSCSAVLGGKQEGKQRTEEYKANMSAAHKGKGCGENNPNWRGGSKITRARGRANHKALGYALLMPLAEGEVEHHVTNEYVIGIPAEVYNSIGGRRKSTGLWF